MRKSSRLAESSDVEESRARLFAARDALTSFIKYVVGVGVDGAGASPVVQTRDSETRDSAWLGSKRTYLSTTVS
ncbi:hypothetical protein HZH68_016062 [Vespula germanica]|uniref:Uncharacterized protein n=2 Tax=Vespula TaxID=7451 RepID=A0A834J475_VESGE|nr:hypothetical protein HZH68_016062 [Vespula germanica]KAF7392372.1 hypothetical protein H0235_017371 [Vespula pensylvanica]